MLGAALIKIKSYLLAYNAMFYSGFLLSLFIAPEDGCDMFLRNVSWLSTDYTRCIPEDRTLHNHRYQNLKSYKNTDACFLALLLGPETGEIPSSQTSASF
jgi:hypothetical protein